MDFQYFWLGPKGPIVGPEGSQRCSRRLQPSAGARKSCRRAAIFPVILEFGNHRMVIQKSVYVGCVGITFLWVHYYNAVHYFESLKRVLHWWNLWFLLIWYFYYCTLKFVIKFNNLQSRRKKTLVCKIPNNWQIFLNLIWWQSVRKNFLYGLKIYEEELEGERKSNNFRIHADFVTTKTDLKEINYGV